MPLVATTRTRPRWQPLTVAASQPVGPDAVAVTLEVPPQSAGAFLGYRAGQYLTVRVRTAEGLESRSYSIATAPTDARVTDRVRIGVAIVPSGRVSPLVAGWRPGDVVEALPPMGDLVVPDPPGGDVLALGAGSGITPVVAIAGDRVHAADGGRLTVVHVARDEERAMFAGELAGLAARHPGAIRLVPVRTATAGRLDAVALRRLVGEELEGAAVVLATGPAAFVETVETAAGRPVRTEVFHD